MAMAGGGVGHWGRAVGDGGDPVGFWDGSEHGGGTGRGNIRGVGRRVIRG